MGRDMCGPLAVIGAQSEGGPSYLFEIIRFLRDQ